MKRKTIRQIVIAATCFVIGAVAMTGCASVRRWGKSVGSDISGGLNRVVTVYDYNGNVLKAYEGKFDVSESENEVYFDLNGKRVIIHGGIVINEEK